MALIASVIELPGAIVVAGVFIRFAQREPEMHVGARAQVLALHLFFHGRDFRRLEAEDLQIGHAPIHFAEIGLLRDRGPILAQRLRLPAQGLQGMGVAHVNAW